MKYPKEYLDEIKNKLKVSEVVSKTVKLKRRGKEFVGLSPFSREKTPSFTVNDQKGFYHCFSSAEHGNIFDFLMKTQSLKFGEAVKQLAALAGVPIYKFSKIDEQREKNWKLYEKILQDYENYCFKNLQSNNFLNVLNYLEKRNIHKTEREKFRIGYASKNNSFLKDNNIYTEEQIKMSGLFFYDEYKKIHVERFRGRIVFPIKNLYGSTIAFGGRIFEKTNMAKYINSPETLFYKKGNNLYNINNLKNSIGSDQENVIIVEGFTDVISLTKNKITKVVANQGTALTDSQLNLVWRFSKNPIICFDGDKSGNEAAVRAAEKLFLHLKPEHNIYFLFLPEDLDPDTFVSKFGNKKFIELTTSKITIYDFLWNYYLTQSDRNNPSSYAAIEKKIKNLCSQIVDKELNKYLLEYFLKKIYTLTPFSNNIKNSKKIKKLSVPLYETKTINTKNEKFSKRILKEFSLLYLMLNYPESCNENIEAISEIDFSSDELNKLKIELINDSLEKASPNKNEKYSNENGIFFKNIKNINQFAPIKNLILVSNDAKDRISELFSDIIGEINSLNAENEIEDLERQLASKMDENTFQNLKKLKSIQKKS